MNPQTPQFYTIFFRDGTRFIGDTEQCVSMIREEARDNSHRGVCRMRQEGGVSARFRVVHQRGQLITPPVRRANDNSRNSNQ